MDKYHRRNVLRRRQEEGALEADLQDLYNDDRSSSGNESGSIEVNADAVEGRLYELRNGHEVSPLEESPVEDEEEEAPRADADWQQNINDICAVVISRLERLHTRVAVLESRRQVIGLIR